MNGTVKLRFCLVLVLGPIDDYRLCDSSVRAARDYPWKGKYTLRVKQSRRDEESRALLHSEDTRQGWMAYAKDLKEHMLFCLGLWPAPRKAPLNARVFDTIAHDDYRVSKVYFQSFPGFFVCGNLYRPVGKREKCPVVLRTMGHWGEGRFHHDQTCSAAGAAGKLSIQRERLPAHGWGLQKPEAERR